jgi:phosphatidate cytidylyltransferase
MLFNIESWDQTILTAMGSVFLVLVIASLIVSILRQAKPQANLNSLIARIKSWWVMAFIFTIAMAVNRTISIYFFGLISFLALREYLSLIPLRKADRLPLFLTYLAIPIQYFWVWYGAYGLFIIFIPVYMFLIIPMGMILIGETTGYLRAIGTYHWGLMTTVFSLSHASYLLVLPLDYESKVSGAGLLLYVVILTQFNDVSQFLWGKTLGKHKIVPKVSPNKTVEGFIGGILTTLVLSYFIAPHITPLTTQLSLWLGFIISVTGFLGDLSISALKRDLGLKDTGTMLPGHGGILDRIDSLTFTAPIAFHFIRYFCF